MNKILNSNTLRISVIVPVGKNDSSWKSLVPDFSLLQKEDEVIFVSPDNLESECRAEFSQSGIKVPFQWIQSKTGRALQQNRGAEVAQFDTLWFIHSDSRLSRQAILKIRTAINNQSDSITFFHLQFLKDGPKWIFLNELGACFRSQVLRLPFGDQGFCLSKSTFKKLGGFDESVAYGEDHLLIWKAHQLSIPVVSLGFGIQTSARKYAERGWLTTTALHLRLTFLQAVPAFVNLIFNREKK